MDDCCLARTTSGKRLRLLITYDHDGTVNVGGDSWFHQHAIMNRLRKARAGGDGLVLDLNETTATDSKKARRRCLNVRTTVASLFVLIATWTAVTTRTRKEYSSFTTTKLNNQQVYDTSHGMTVADALALRTVSVTDPIRSHVHRVTPTAAQQIEHYRRGTALIINVHFTHHGGTYACKALGKAPGRTGAPTFACMGVTEADNVTDVNFPQPEQVPWTKEETPKNIEIVRPYFHFLK